MRLTRVSLAKPPVGLKLGGGEPIRARKLHANCTLARLLLPPCVRFAKLKREIAKQDDPFVEIASRRKPSSRRNESQRDERATRRDSYLIESEKRKERRNVIACGRDYVISRVHRVRSV